MSDVGTALKLTSATQRLKDSCGTKIYWPPEFYDKNYGLKVDVWALGVIQYGLLDGRVPFKTEEDVRKKVIRLPANTPEVCKKFTMSMLNKEEDKRADAFAVVSHEWLAQQWSNQQTEEKDGDFKAEGMREGGANAAQDERRKELVERLADK